MPLRRWCSKVAFPSDKRPLQSEQRCLWRSTITPTRRLYSRQPAGVSGHLPCRPGRPAPPHSKAVSAEIRRGSRGSAGWDGGGSKFSLLVFHAQRAVVDTVDAAPTGFLRGLSQLSSGLRRNVLGRQLVCLAVHIGESYIASPMFVVEKITLAAVSSDDPFRCRGARTSGWPSRCWTGFSSWHRRFPPATAHATRSFHCASCVPITRLSISRIWRIVSCCSQSSLASSYSP